ncbi:hypothetical protein [Acinetobacter guillouiae]|uniref:hypothetical protein n=1 Tax=Acinetobacter guillouiae TaxID=106649 RepID=UPI0004EF6066|nr:hypothetical protein [Acinetobacter guillouiae]BAP36675.1 hypothetical protein AS4_17350 [Acinetobacter guillouiae]
MEIKYLKDAPLGKKGEVATVQEHEAKILIALGIAKLQKKSDPKLLLNLNGTPVVDDFGGLVSEKGLSKSK